MITSKIGPSRSLTIITPVLPERSEFLADTAATVEALREACRTIGWRVTWAISIDGPGYTPPVSPEVVIRLASRRGAAAARNALVGIVESSWILPLDADDLLEPDGTLDILSYLASAPSSVGWVSANRLLIDGGRTVHWTDSPRPWLAGELAASWRAPFPFHPNAILARTDLILECGGWPAIPTNEDMALCLIMSERSAGRSLAGVFGRYRVWPGQEVAGSSYVQDKVASFVAIERFVNTLRQSLGRPPVTAPDPGPAYGRMPVAAAIPQPDR